MHKTVIVLLSAFAGLGCLSESGTITTPDGGSGSDAGAVADSGALPDGGGGASDGGGGAPDGGDAGFAWNAGNPNRPCSLQVPVEGQPANVAAPTTIVGTGTPASCTFTALSAAVAKGGVIGTLTIADTTVTGNTGGHWTQVSGGSVTNAGTAVGTNAKSITITNSTLQGVP